ncbi:ankyrin repeat domain-containing protein [Niabella drilacis]|uniref:Ankyrin repeat n=1 Tax=Niabella drilacis (strain DSM 25811 / CCM 8410 / CCUG 62505 / LMG 26954 / E90) TaxID=1285928 RepID=A0A1G6IQC5_NIADE|nr:ankyrin repeat domain-containing protein [Niabella drilacis]SDC08633.1 Ankyrin repeat [Niabella drilacis]
MKLFGPNAELTEIAQQIMAEDIAALENKATSGWNISQKIQITRWVAETPLTLALSEKRKKVLDWLLSKKVELNDAENPAILGGCSSGDIKTVKRLIEEGAAVNARHKTGKSAMGAALYGNHYHLISVLIEAGYDLKKDGSSLRQAVSNRQYKAIALLLDQGVDVNFCKPDMVYPYNSTPVHIAAKRNDVETVKLLVAHGADVTIKDHYGERPYNCAAANQNEEMKAFLKALEPEQWHNEEQRLEALKSYKLPDALLKILRSADRRIELPGNENVRFIEFNALLDVKEVNWMKHKFLDLLSAVDNYSSDGFLVWYPKKKCFAFADYEHQEFKELCSVKEFFADPSTQIDKIVE